MKKFAESGLFLSYILNSAGVVSDVWPKGLIFNNIGRTSLFFPHTQCHQGFLAGTHFLDYKNKPVNLFCGNNGVQIFS